MALLIVIALACAIFAPAPPPVQELSAPAEIRVGDMAQIAEIDEVKDAAAPNGTYKKTDKGWQFIPDEVTDGNKAQVKRVAASANAGNGETMATVGGFAILAGLTALALKISGVGKGKRAAGNGVSQIQYQALLRRLDGMARIMENVTPEEEGAKAVERRKRR